MRILLLGFFLIAFCPVWGQQKTLAAVEATSPPKIDGVLDDEVWKTAPIAKDFIQHFPTFGQPELTKSEVRILYDDDAVYIGAYFKDDPAQIRKQLTARDEEERQDVDYFFVFFDTYLDKQNAFMFGVTTKNVQTDIRLSENGGDDRSWNAVWESNTTITADGWVAELRIPYISLRFAKKDVQNWGLQFQRFTRRNNEMTFWNPVNPAQDGVVNQFGQWEGIKDLSPPLRLSFSPYVSTGVRMNPEGSRRQTEWLRSGGMDVKWGINESFTLDATLIPDFGQVISDNVVNNLSPFEVQFQENRPFFTEGTELFDKAGLFYSRRVGATPGLYGDVESLAGNGSVYELVKNPSVTQLYNAIKLSGRTRKKLGIGIFNAVTAPSEAVLRNLSTGKDTLIQTEPLTNYNIIVLDQALKGRSSLTFTNTNVIRNGSRDANVTSFDWAFFTPSNTYKFGGTARYSKIFGLTPFYGNDINLVYDTINKNGTTYVQPYDGFSGALTFNKISGAVQFYYEGSLNSNTYDPGDLGFLQTPNIIHHRAGIGYNKFTPTDKFFQYRYWIHTRTSYLYKPYRYAETEIAASAFYYLKNFWDLTFSVSSFPFTQYDYFELRTPGKYVQKPAEITFGFSGSTDSRKRLYFSWGGRYSTRAKKDNNYNNFEVGLRYRFSDQFLLSAEYFRQYENNQIGFAFSRDADGEPVLGYRDFTESVSLVSGIYNFTSRLNLTLRARHYWNTVGYNSFYRVDINGRHLPHAPLSDRDQNYNAFNLDAFVTWDFRLGSRLILGWKNYLGDNSGINRMENRSYLANLGKTFGLSHGNEVTLRLIYFLDYNSLKK